MQTGRAWEFGGDFVLSEWLFPTASAGIIDLSNPDAKTDACVPRITDFTNRMACWHLGEDLPATSHDSKGLIDAFGRVTTRCSSSPSSPA